MVSEDFEEVDNDIDLSLDDEELETPELPEPEPDEEDDQDYSKKVNKRIGKIVAQRNRERDQRLAEQSRREAIEQENMELRQALQQQRETTDQSTLEQLRKQKKDALEIDDYDAIVDIDEKIMDHKTRQAPVFEPQPEPQPQPVAEVPEALQSWQQDNQWVFDPNHPKTVKANALYAKLLDSGFEPDDPDTFKELDKKLKREVPPPTPSPDRGQVTAIGGTQFTVEDKRLMPEFGLDPDNKEHRRQWAISKKQAAANG